MLFFMARLKPLERRAQLLYVGRTLWSSASYDAVSSASIAAATGCSIGLVYHHFGSKRGFYVAVIRDLAEEILRATELSPDKSLPESLRGALAAFVALVGRLGGILRAVLRGGVGFDEEVEGIVEGLRWRLVDRILARLELDAEAHIRRRLYGWIGYVEFVALDWEACRDLREEELVALLSEAFGKLMK